MNRPGRNVAASVRARLMNEAKRTRTDYNQLLVRYVIERLLYRLSVSPHRGSFVLKGAMLFAVWEGSSHRPTQDVDFLGFGEPSAQRLTDVFRELCELEVEKDGIIFDAASVTAEEIRAVDAPASRRTGVAGAPGRRSRDPRLVPRSAAPGSRHRREISDELEPGRGLAAHRLSGLIKAACVPPTRSWNLVDKGEGGERAPSFCSRRSSDSREALSRILRMRGSEVKAFAHSTSTTWRASTRTWHSWTSGCLVELLPHQEAIERHLRRRLGELFELSFDILLYDLTSTYFEGQCAANPQAQRGHSRDSRGDCPQVVIALIVTPDGYPLGYEVFAGNTADSTTVRKIVGKVEQEHGRCGRIWVMGRGSVSAQTLAFLRGGQYILGTPKAILPSLTVTSKVHFTRATWGGWS